MSTARLYQYYTYKTDFEIWKENQDFGRQHISMSQLPLEFTPIGTNTKKEQCQNWTWFLLEQKRQNPRHEQDQQNLERKGKISHISVPGVRPIIVRLIIDRIWFLQWQQMHQI